MSDPSGLGAAIVAFLQSATPAGADRSKLTQAAELVRDAFKLDADQVAAAPQPGLEAIWDVFTKTQQKMSSSATPPASAAAAAPASSTATSSSSQATPSAEDKSKADELKTAGNKAMSSKDFSTAIASYTSAIALDPTSPVYFSNRSAAYSQVGQHDSAVSDARAALELDPKFGKAYSRMGHALFSLGKYEEAVEAYTKGLEIDPDNAVMQSGLETAKKQAASSGSSATAESNDALSRDAGASAGAGGGFPGMPGMGGGAGGMPDLGSLLNNPMLMQMAQNMMSNGGLDQIMQNPMIRQMAERMGGGGAGGSGAGGMPDMAQIQQMMQDPAMQNLARNMMGGGGAGGGAGRGAGGAGGNADNNMYG